MNHWAIPTSRAIQVACATLLLAAISSCQKDEGHGHSHDSEGKEAAPAAEHGEKTELGTLDVAGYEFSITRFGEVKPGEESAFEVHGVGISEAELARLNLYLWVEDEAGTQLSAPAKGDREGAGLHFHVVPRAGKETPHRVVVRLRSGETDERAGLPLSGHGHEHHDGPHDGMLASFEAGGAAGYLELKLHDDKGDLELWLARDEKISQPYDLPLSSGIEVEFIDVGGRKVTLRPRNTEQNEDEDGNPNIRGGRTNYFIYPSREGEDATWLQGKEFSSIVVVRFEADGQNVESEEFVLKPHVH